MSLALLHSRAAALVSRVLREASGRAVMSPFVTSRHVVPVSILLGALLSAALGAGIAGAGVASRSDILPLSEVKPGMKGYGLTVFSGFEPERFEVEVISTLRNFRPHQDLILIKTPHPRLEVAHTVAGMSGSPIYLDGKMIGAYAYGWTFGSEAIAGVTPIQSMLDELARPLPGALAPAVGGPFPGAASSMGEPDLAVVRPAQLAPSGLTADPSHWDLREQAAARAPRERAAGSGGDVPQLRPAVTPLLLGGLGRGAFGLAQELLTPLGLEPVEAGGSGSANPGPEVPTNYVDGGAISVELVRGDISASGLGTVTRVEGDKLLAFGHPMLNGGVESLPTAIARVHWLLATQNRSFKIGEAARSLGALVNDRQAAIVVDTKARAPVFPMRIDFKGVDGAPHPVWNVEVAHDPFMAPTFVAMALGSALEATTAERRDMTYRVVSRVELERFGTVTLVDFGAGSGAIPDAQDFARSQLVKALGGLLSNPWEEVRIRRIETTMSLEYKRDVVRLRGARVLQAVVDAGEPLQIALTLEPHRGALETKLLELSLPLELAGRDVEIELEPGYEAERPLPAAQNVPELLSSLLLRTYPPESVVATVRLRENGVAQHGKVATSLPPGAVDTLRASTGSSGPETFVSEARFTTPLGRYLQGKDTVRVAVRAPLR